MKLGMLLVVVAWLMAGCAPVSEPFHQPIVQSQQWRMDPSGLETWQAAEQATDWQVLQEWKSWGFGPETVWIRLRLNATPEDVGNTWVVRVRPPFLDHVTLHDPASGRVLRSGDALPSGQHELTSINFSLQIPALPHERTVYLQMRSTSARTLHVEVLPQATAQQRDRLQEWTMGFVMASSAIFCLWATLQWWVTREKVMGAFALKQLLATGWAFFILGFARVVIGPWLPEGVLTTISSTVFIGLIVGTLWFFATLLEAYQPARLALRAIRLLAVVVAMLPMLHGFGITHIMLSLANQAVLLGFVLLLLALLSAVPKRVRQPIPIWVLIVYLLIYSTLNSWPPLIHLGWIEAQRIVLFGSLAHTVLDGIVMFVILQIRARSMRKTQVQVALDLQRTQQQAEDEKRHREEQSQLFAMLAHEMKTPLGTLRMWMEAGQLKPETMERAIHDMNQVIERCVHTGQLGDEGLQPVWQAVEPVALTQTCIQNCRAPGQVAFEAIASDGWLRTDAQMLSIVLGNLLDNACKYGTSDGPTQVRLQHAKQNQQSGWRWTISNPIGPAGLPDASRVFDKYYRSPLARRISGSGLGLFLVKGLVRLMEGDIRYQVLDHQVVFVLWLPARPGV